jgi:cell division protein FtsN
MTRGKKGDNHEMVLESRHLLGVFFAVVLLCALFFTFGFVLGRSQDPGRSATVLPAQKLPPADEVGFPEAKDLSFYDRVEGKPASESPARQEPSRAPAPSPPKRQQPTASTQSTRSQQTVYLQVAALTKEPDAQRLARKLKELGFPVVVRPPQSDRFHRVQVGPFENAELADAAQRRLAAHGYREVVRR